MKPLLFGTSLFLFLAAASSCVTDPCLDLAELDSYKALVHEWYVHDSIGNQIIVDKQGISQTLIASAKSTHTFNNTVEDDCGNTYGSFYFSIQYNTSFTPIHFMVDIHGAGIGEPRFYLQLMVTNTANSNYHKKTQYDFETLDCADKHADIQLLSQYSISEMSFTDVLEITFHKIFSAKDVKTVYYAKGIGIIKYTTADGDSYQLRGLHMNQ